MSNVFVLQNQDQLLLTKKREWSDGREVNALFRSPYRDIALNEMIEVNSKDILQRISILECETSKKDIPLIPAEHMPPPLPQASTEFDAEFDEPENSTPEIKS